MIDVPIWNGTVANIVLMSLGGLANLTISPYDDDHLYVLLGPRSAPEILLSIVGILGNGFQQDELGPSLIVGSGAFNLLIISAISVVVIPSGETRQSGALLLVGSLEILSSHWLKL